MNMCSRRNRLWKGSWIPMPLLLFSGTRITRAAFPIRARAWKCCRFGRACRNLLPRCRRSEEHTSELQSRLHLVCRLLLEKKKQALLLESLLTEPCLASDGQSLSLAGDVLL